MTGAKGGIAGLWRGLRRRMRPGGGTAEVTTYGGTDHTIVAGDITIEVHSFFRPDKSVDEIIAMATDSARYYRLDNPKDYTYRVRIYRPVKDFDGGILPVPVDIYSKDGGFFKTAYYDFEGYE